MKKRVSKRKVLMIIPGLKFHIDEGAKHRLYSFVDTYIEANYQISVLLLFSYQSFPHLLQYKKYLRKDVKWILFPSFSLNKNLVLKYCTILSAQIIIFFLNLFNKYTFIQAEHHYGGQMARFKRKNTPLIVDFHGESIDEYQFLHPQLEDNHPLIKSMKKSTKEAIQLANLVIVVSENLKNTLEKISNEDINNYFVMPCCVDYEKFQTTPPLALSKIYSNRLVVGYSGGLQKWQNIHYILDIVIALQKKIQDIFFLLLTNYSTEDIQEKLNNLGSNNYAVYSLTNEQVPAFLPLMDAGFLIRDKRILNQVSSPTKILEYLAAGVPIIATQYSGDINETVTHGLNGFILSEPQTTGNEAEDLFNFLCKVKINRTSVREKCRESIKNRTWKDFAIKLLHQIDNLSK